MVTPHPPGRRIVTIVTAGHVDHGKSALVEALTGQHPDRLLEERQRSMTIALGFAATDLPNGTTLSLIDVPGHERLIEVMIAGAAGVDAALLVVAADDGPMPQTDEHLDVLRLLHVPRVIVAVSRIDLVAPDVVDRVVASVGDLLADRGWPRASIIATSARTGQGVDDLRIELEGVPVQTHGWGFDDAAWLPIDRSFTIRGAGTVVTGTLQRGTLSVGQRVHLESGTFAVVRGLERHGSPFPVAGAGHRVAVNLASLTGPVPVRGEILSDRPVPSTRAVIAGLERLDETAGTRSDETVRVLGGAWRRNARLRPLESAGNITTGVRLVRIQFEQPVAVGPGERLLVRRPAPSAILAGAVVLDRSPPRRLSPDDLAALTALAAGDPVPVILLRTGRMPVCIGEVLADLPAVAHPALDMLVASGAITALSGCSEATASHTGDAGWLIRTSTLHGLVGRITEALDRRTVNHPQLPEVSRAGLGPILDVSPERIEPILDWAQRRSHLLNCGPALRLLGARPTIPTAIGPIVDELLRSAASAPGWLVRPPDELDPATLAVLEREARSVMMPDGRVVLGERFDGFVTWLLAALPSKSIGLRAVADGLGMGRDAAQQLLESTDRLGLTVRVGNHRVPGPGAEHWRRQRIARRQRRLGIELLGTAPVGRADPFCGVTDVFVVGDDTLARLFGISLGLRVTFLPSIGSRDGDAEPLAAISGGSSASRVILCPLGHAADDATIAARDVGVRLRRQGTPVRFYDDVPDLTTMRNGHPGDAVGALAERGIGMPSQVIVRATPSNETDGSAMIVPGAAAAGAVSATDGAEDSDTAHRIRIAGRRWAGIEDGALRFWSLSGP